MSHQRPQRRTWFTPEEANATLPLVRAIVSDLVRLSHEVIDRRERLAFLLDGREPDSGGPYREELTQIEEEVEKDTRRLREYVEELRQLGVEPKGVTEGLVDFPSRMDGREVCLCWQLGELEVLYWHEPNAGFQGRQPLTAACLAEDRGQRALAHPGED